MFLLARRGFTKLELIILVIVIAAFAILPTRNIHYSPVRANVARARSDMRSLATAIESYHIDYGVYPAWKATQERNVDGPQSAAPYVLTTPTAYISSLHHDPFNYKYTYSYYSTHDPDNPNSDSWILWSPGPDRKFDITLNHVITLYNPNSTTPSLALVPYTYDPTNGTESGGDIWRVRDSKRIQGGM